MPGDLIWQVKIAARIHDPAEKALVLLRDPAGHEGGTSAALARLLGQFEIGGGRIAGDEEQGLVRTVFAEGIPAEVYRIVRRADWWAAAADRPQWPLTEITVTTKTGVRKTFAVAPWAQVRWYQDPVLIHPLSGATYRLPGALSHTDLDDIKHRSFEHFANLLELCGLGKQQIPDWRKLALALWRFGPELAETEDSGKLGELWKLLPADTRVPDHTIWDHLDLVSAFAGAFATGNGQAALLAFSIGPVQSFLETARKAEDLWAGSHLLARMAWEAAKPLCEELGPDAIVFPRLRGIPLVDLWLRDKTGLPAGLFSGCPWRGRAPDANPLFAAALPNRFVAIVPADKARELAERCRDRVREWTLELGLRVVDRLLEIAQEKAPGAPREETVPAYAQMREQLKNFPEVHWASASFELCPPQDPGVDVAKLRVALAPFYGVSEGEPAGFLATPAWKILSKQIDLPGKTVFYAPNPGVLYPAIYELAERLLAAAKSVRPFEQSRQEGWRCTLSGESEWLTTDWAQRLVPRGQRRSRGGEGFIEGQHVETLWTKIADRQPALAKEGEHLGALAAIKRLWPTLFAEEVRAETGGIRDRFVISTHTMALGAQLEQWLENTRQSPAIPEGLKARLEADDIRPVALPRRIVSRHHAHPLLDYAKRIPAVLDAARESEDEERYAAEVGMVRKLLALGKENDQEPPRVETYYGLLLMDGDRMGAILSGEAATAITFRESFHPQVREAFQRGALRAALEPYAAQRRPVSPNRHLVISGALSDFSQIVVPYVVEEEFPGRLIYAGGDDVLAMLPAACVLQVAARLRWVYSGSSPDEEGRDWTELRSRAQQGLVSKGGFACLRGKLIRMMGPRVTASCGVVIAHHQAPLSFVLRELRAAEQAAKNYERPGDGQSGLKNRDAIHIRIIKRSGGKLELSLDWGEPLALLEALRSFLAREEVSRRAVYLTLEWLDHVPETNAQLAETMLAAMLGYQLKRQSLGGAAKEAPALAARLAKQAVRHAKPKEWLTHFFCVADFLAREQRQARAGGGQ